MDKIMLATGNENKVEEMRPRFRDRGFELEQVVVDVEEVQAVDIEKVAGQKVRDSFQKIEGAEKVIIEDTGFFVESLDGFPGAMASFFAETVGAEGLLDLLENAEDRSAYFRTAIACFDGEDLDIFIGEVHGEVPERERGEPKPYMPYDSFFVPEGASSSFAEDPGLKREVSQRKRAVDKFLDWLENR